MNNEVLANLQKFCEIAEFINAKDLLSELEAIKERTNQTNADLVFPLVGEFSAGKTTLINALTDSKKLETATKPTTATIYEIHFGCEKCCATVYDEQGNETTIDDISSLKNDALADANFVKIYDTATRIPSTTVLVDTPGLSSPDPKHKQTLVNFLPKADGILLVTDINQQITRSLTDFIELMKLSKRPIYLVITKCDTKSPSELEKAKQYISENCKLPLQQLACVSAAKNNMSELFTLFEHIQQNKNTILERANQQRIKNIANELASRIDELLSSSTSDKELDEAIRRQEFELNKLNKNIDKLIDRSKEDISDCARNTTRRFDDIISVKLESLVANKSNDFDAEALSLINNTSSLLLTEYKSSIKEALRKQVSLAKDTDESINLRSLTEIDMSELSISGISYNIDLNNAGHQYDSLISTVTKGVAVAAAAATVIVAAAPAVGAAAAGTAAAETATAGATAAGAASNIGNIINMADTASDVASIVSNNKTARRIEKAVLYTKTAKEQFSTINKYNQQFGQHVGSNKGIVESIVGFATDKIMGKPQRKRAIHNYMNDILLPEFKHEIERISIQLINLISHTLHTEAEELINQKTTTLQELKNERTEKKQAFEQRISQLNNYKLNLLNS